MQKQANFFEQHVQWFALGLGALFLLFMAYKYALNRPVTTDVGGTVLGPGEVEKATLEGPVKQLKGDIARDDVPEIRQEDYVERFVATIKGSKEQLASLSRHGIASYLPDGVQTGPGGETFAGPGEPGGPPITDLPVPPVARPGSTISGRSTVAYDDPKWVPRPNREAPIINADKDWVSVQFIIRGSELYTAFTKAFDENKILDANMQLADVMKTSFLDVELERQEVLPDGKFGKPQVVKPLLNSTRRPFPAKEASREEVTSYLDFVTKVPADLLKPVFYEVVSGDVWLPPNEETDKMQAEQRVLLAQQAQQAAAQRNQQRRDAAAAGRMNRRGFPPGGLDGDMEGWAEPVDELGRPLRMFPQGRQPLPAPALPGVRRQPGAAPVVNNQIVDINTGVFPVDEALGNIEIIAHDDEVLPGKTYRYRLRYRIHNPLWDTIRAAPPELTKRFALESKFSQWSKDVKIRPKIEFFLVDITLDKSRFHIFYFEKGKWRKDEIITTPGDPIGKTGSNVVDVRGSGGKAYTLVMDELGDVDRRVKETTNDRYQELDALTAQPTDTVGQVGLSR